jgi:hypothetical protein
MRAEFNTPKPEIYVPITVNGIPVQVPGSLFEVKP